MAIIKTMSEYPIENGIDLITDQMPYLKLPLFLILCLVCSSCSYRIMKYTANDGEIIRTRQYKSYLRQHEYKCRQIYKRRRDTDTILQYADKITIDTLTKGFCIHYDSFALYGRGKDFKRYINLFTSGLVSPQMLYKTINSRAPAGTAFMIRGFRLLHKVNARSTQRRFLLVGSNYRLDAEYYLLELTNEHAKKWTCAKVFLKGAKVTRLKLGWVDI